MSPANWEGWVKSGGAPERLQMRQAVHLILIAVSECKSIKQSMFMNNPSFPTLKVKVAYAVSDNSKRHQRLIGGMSSDVVELDFSFNETTQTTTSLQVTDGSAIFRYSLADLVAEKYRSLLQQPIRKRNRRQDVYDIHWLLQKEGEELDRRKPEIKSALEQSAKARGIHISKEAIRDPLVIKMASEEYAGLAQEIDGVLPEFDVAFDAVAAFYEGLGW